ncbi:nitrate reductase cytochrome c-type subunit [Rhodoferax sp.]|uniref:nitrate reductase cytochrome c-type subunit n=1 Tax=Rhodoferax sp. TaxID=50421 RepID=UPI001A0B2517|nr:nitrate reductase cytochrome c-type subunit [Rhodoferax sp.]MBE0474955.1 nitrate reductase cytochrome c-type subunit [Rhodoferax sp.]
MNKTLKVSLLTLLAVTVVACASSAVQVGTLREASVSSADTAPDVKPYLGKRPGQFALIERSFASQPPLVPHNVDGFDISQTENACWDCHSSDEFKGKKMPMVSKSHLVKGTEAKADPELDMKRWQCDNCHVPQVDAKPLVGNDFTNR